MCAAYFTSDSGLNAWFTPHDQVCLYKDACDNGWVDPLLAPTSCLQSIFFVTLRNVDKHLIVYCRKIPPCLLVGSQNLRMATLPYINPHLHFQRTLSVSISPFLAVEIIPLACVLANVTLTIDLYSFSTIFALLCFKH